MGVRVIVWVWVTLLSGPGAALLEQMQSDVKYTAQWCAEVYSFARFCASIRECWACGPFACLLQKVIQAVAQLYSSDFVVPVNNISYSAFELPKV